MATIGEPEESWVAVFSLLRHKLERFRSEDLTALKPAQRRNRRATLLCGHLHMQDLRRWEQFSQVFSGHRGPLEEESSSLGPRRLLCDLGLRFRQFKAGLKSIHRLPDDVVDQQAAACDAPMLLYRDQTRLLSSRHASMTPTRTAPSTLFIKEKAWKRLGLVSRVAD
jgi:hypothetical protein